MPPQPNSLDQAPLPATLLGTTLVPSPDLPLKQEEKPKQYKIVPNLDRLLVEARE